ncbi:Pyruvate/2-oxoglutarate dehydrogenase complex, dihydrolipoamide dehydrogenase (E3) component [Nonomuraea maritima]|uniref:Pyruvate/2-oxoglutarate dehydrogenase complex, dihydrolipoamide dehydrogenase (E3) component n=1 Tax=Nonomuraea maritima TaxID=683260 RepID=A0A1G9CD23_9ACTN|nr:FAD/NAD(P)-binding oxidoreductase [Nonomuraea maritima]SDK49476.1 Pyruvate/2-oxoglutarate dehydrogenase complex, dihydrolipoamide dehydrogenase (E3) component [Nonomuraea maritima]
MTQDLTYDLVVVGGGPAGVAGALTAALAGLRVTLLDSGARLGGQYFRHAAVPRREPGLDRFLRQVRELGARADVLTRHQVWNVSREPDGDVTVHAHTRDASGERPVTLRARRLLIATGAHDRPLPFPGWDLPGVLTAGGAQALLKGGNVLAGRRVVVSGTGPFLLPVATGLAGAGARVLGVYEAGGGLGLARHPLLALGKAAETAGYAAALVRHRVPYRPRHAVVAAHGEREVEAVTVARLDADWNVLTTSIVACDTVAVGYGFVPQIELGTQLGCDTRAEPDGSVVLAVDAAQRTSVPGVWAAGEPTGVAGWAQAEVEGRIAGRAVVADARPQAVRGSDGVLLRRRSRGRAFGAALHEAYPVRPGWQGWLRDDTLVCRCEEVPLARVREAQELGATDARSVKLLARPGMGWCQGRICGYAVSCLAGEPPAPPRRPIAQPVTLGALSEAAPPDAGSQDDPAH